MEGTVVNTKIRRFNSGAKFYRVEIPLSEDINVKIALFERAYHDGEYSTIYNLVYQVTTNHIIFFQPTHVADEEMVKQYFGSKLEGEILKHVAVVDSAVQEARTTFFNEVRKEVKNTLDEYLLNIQLEPITPLKNKPESYFMPMYNQS